MVPGCMWKRDSCSKHCSTQSIKSQRQSAVLWGLLLTLNCVGFPWVGDSICIDEPVLSFKYILYHLLHSQVEERRLSHFWSKDLGTDPISQRPILHLEKAMATHSSTLAWKISWMEEPGRLQSRGSLGVRHDWATSLSLSCIGEGNGNPLQYSCLENPRDGGAWCSAVYGVAQSRTRLKRLSSSILHLPLLPVPS